MVIQFLSAKAKRNVGGMAAQNAPEADIDGYISSEGMTTEQLRVFQEPKGPVEVRWTHDEANKKGEVSVRYLTLTPTSYRNSGIEGALWSALCAISLGAFFYAAARTIGWIVNGFRSSS